MKYTNFMQATDEFKDTCDTIAMEECSELIQAISKAKRGKLDKTNLTEEIADVLISIDWLMKIYKIDLEDVLNIRTEKEDRILSRLNSNSFR